MLAMIERELAGRQHEVPPHSVQTLYFGGGTPSVCAPAEIARLVRQVRKQWDVDRFEEVTLEANPDDLSRDYLTALRAAGIDRLSIGVQSFHDRHLERMNRRHTARAAVEAVEAAAAAGFPKITIDLIYGVPGMTLREWQEDLEQAIALPVQHISAYHLTIEPSTVFGKRGLSPVEESVSEQHYALLRERLLAVGFEHYEVSNFALPGHRARHNSAYWRGEPYLGIGPSAHSYDGRRRRSWNVSSNPLYLAGTPPEEERLTDTDLLNEYLMTRLRTAEGISLSEISTRFGETETRRLEPLLAGFEAAGDLFRTPAGWAIEPARWLVSDFVISRLFR